MIVSMKQKSEEPAKKQSLKTELKQSQWIEYLR